MLCFTTHGGRFMSIKHVGVVGAGVMGVGIAQNLAETGHQVTLLDVSDEILKRAQSELHNNIRLARMVLRDPNRESVSTILSRINSTVDYAPLHEVDFVVENVIEKPDVKRDVYARLDAVCPEPIVFAANTSAIPIGRIASWTRRPDRVVGMHLMNPVPMTSTAEVIRGAQTSESTIETVKAFLSALNKQFVIVNDSPGFVSNRVLMLTINEAIFLVQEEVASVADIDRIFKSCFCHKMGPLETADLIGLDTILDSINVLFESFNDSKYKPCPLLEKMVESGLRGRKSGQGFYTY